MSLHHRRGWPMIEPLAVFLKSLAFSDASQGRRSLCMRYIVGPAYGRFFEVGNLVPVRLCGRRIRLELPETKFPLTCFTNSGPLLQMTATWLRVVRSPMLLKGCDSPFSIDPLTRTSHLSLTLHQVVLASFELVAISPFTTRTSSKSCVHQWEPPSNENREYYRPSAGGVSAGSSLRNSSKGGVLGYCFPCIRLSYWASSHCFAGGTSAWCST